MNIITLLNNDNPEQQKQIWSKPEAEVLDIKFNTMGGAATTNYDGSAFNS